MDVTPAARRAAGPELNAFNPGLFRHEVRVLEHLGNDPLWPALLASYDQPDSWVALLLEDVGGRPGDRWPRSHPRSVGGAVAAPALMLRMEWAELAQFDDLVATSPALAALDDGQVTCFLFALGAWLAHRTATDDSGPPA